MIDYDVLCQTIEDWKAGRRPSAPIPGPTPAAPSAAYDVDSGLVEMDGEDAEYAEGDAAGAAASEYGSGAYAQPGEYGDGSGAYAQPGEYGDGSGAYAQPGEYGDGSGAYAQPVAGGAYVEQSYGEPISVQDGYAGSDGTPEYVERTGTPRVEQTDEPPPYAASEPAPYTEMIPTEDTAAAADDDYEEMTADEDIDVDVDADDDEHPAG